MAWFSRMSFARARASESRARASMLDFHSHCPQAAIQSAQKRAICQLRRQALNFQTTMKTSRLITFLCLFSLPAFAAVTGYEWTFNAANLDDSLGNGTMAPAGATVPVFAVTDGTTIPHIGGAPARVLSVPQFTDPLDGYNLTFSASGANGGGAYVNEYTFVWDLYSPGSADWQALFQTAPDNPAGNDADFYIAPDGRLGLGSTYAAPGTIQQNTWYRIGFTANLALNRVTYYVNGVQVAQGVGTYPVDGRFSLYSNADAGPDVRLFNEGDTSGVYTHALYLNSIAFVDRELTADEFAALGGPKADGILVPEPATGLLILGSLGALVIRPRRRH
jgi:hypothetical protein